MNVMVYVMKYDAECMYNIIIMSDEMQLTEYFRNVMEFSNFCFQLKMEIN